MRIQSKFHKTGGNITLADSGVQQVGNQYLERALLLSRESYGASVWTFSFPNDLAVTPFHHD